MTDLFGLKQQPKRTNDRPEAAALATLEQMTKHSGIRLTETI